MFRAVLVANRGEIAVRVIRTLRAMGIRSVAVYTDADRNARHVTEADSAVAIGAASAYLDVERIVAAAVTGGAEALHPGYGFLSENPALARRCAQAGIVFVGPPPEAMEMMGDKINAKRATAAAGVPVVPGRDEAGLDDAELAAAAGDIGLPVLLKPSAGGGGKGMRRVDDPAQLADQIAAARREAIGAFGDGTLLVERFVTRPRHIEIQVFADTHGAVVALGERECSLQRRHQKIVEEAPSGLLDDTTRAAMGAAAVAAAKACGYVGAGTVEFIVSADRPDEFFFMEMNTRLQVEHPVTEAVLGLDLVEWQLRVAAGEHLPWAAAPPAGHGHAVEARIYAEDAARGFLPATGTVLRLVEPAGRPHIRVDSSLLEGLVVGTDYDPMLAKVVAWGEDRARALARLATALAATEILGVTTNVGFLRRLVEHPDVVAGRLDTELVERVAVDLVGPPGPSEVVAAAAQLAGLLSAPAGPVVDPWDMADGWRLTGPAQQASQWRVAGQVVDVVAAAGRARLDGPAVVIDGDRRYGWAVDGETVWLGSGGDAWALTRLRETIGRSGPAGSGAGPVTSPMPGTVLAVYVEAGQTVHAGQALVAVEAMKMEHVVVAPIDGVVGEVSVEAGDSVKLDQPLATVVAPGADS
ncbi:MAG TPA: biotin carboxylase N-terminal domain-containing protein [Acidimicrobiales bacterium]